MTSSSWYPIVKTGFKLVIGSWNIIVISLPRILYISFIGILAMSYEILSPSASFSSVLNLIEPPTICPCGAWTNCIIEREVTLLPQPDSPTTPIILLFGIEKETPFTDLTVPLSVKKFVSRFSISITLFGSFILPL